MFFLFSGAPRMRNGRKISLDIAKKDDQSEVFGKEDLEILLKEFLPWSTDDIVEGRLTTKISVSTATQIRGSIQRFAAFQKGLFSFKKENIVEFCKELLSKGRRKKYVADQVVLRHCTHTYFKNAPRCTILSLSQDIWPLNTNG